MSPNVLISQPHYINANFSVQIKHAIELVLSAKEFRTLFGSFLCSFENGTLRLKVVNAKSEEVCKKKYASEIKIRCNSVVREYYNSALNDVVFYSAKKEEVAEVETSSTVHQESFSANALRLPISKTNTFKTFITSQSNIAAYTVSKSLVTSFIEEELPDNVIGIYGNVGNGKTHLLHAVANEAARNGVKCLYTSSEKFLSCFVHASKHNILGSMKENVLNADIILLDDLHFLTSKKGTLSELYQVIKNLVAHGKVFVFACLVHPSKMNFGAKDKTLLEFGMVKDMFSGSCNIKISNPDFKMRIAIIEAKLKATKLKYDKSLVAFLGSTVSSNVRDIAGVVNQMSMNNKFFGHPMNIDSAKVILEEKYNIVAGKIKSDTVDENEVLESVKSHVCTSIKHQVNLRGRLPLDICGTAIIMKILHQKQNMTTKTIASLLGKKSHATVLAAIRKIENLETEANFGISFAQINKIVNSYS